MAGLLYPANEEKLDVWTTHSTEFLHARHLQTPAARSAVSTAASSTDTIGSSEDVHSYEDWELSSETDAGSEVSAREDGGDSRELSSEASRPTTSSGCFLRSCERTSDSHSTLEREDLDINHDSSGSNQADPVQDTEDGVNEGEDIPDNSCHNIERVHSVGSQGSVSAGESPEWTNEPDNAAVAADFEPAPRSCRDGLVDGTDSARSMNVGIDERPTTEDAQFTPRTENSNEQDNKHVKKSIQVFVRVRPLSTWSNEGEEDTVVVRPGDEANSIRVQSSGGHGNNCVVTECSFDQVFTERSSQEEVFDAVQPSVRASLDGYNATVFAYGQTGTGKTHTIFGEDTHSGEHEKQPAVKSTWGIIPRALIFLLDQAEAMTIAGIDVTLQLSFMQIYNDRLFDLFTDRRRQRPLLIREQPTIDGGTNVVLQGLSSERVTTLDGALQLLRQGRANRTVRETELNSSSSRSHAIVQINITSERSLGNGERRTRRSRLNLVDLAGSEKWNTDLEMEEAHSFELKNINSSLSALGNCIAALTEAGRKHIPYRDSTLTRVLQDSFGGNTQACLIATVSPSARASEETIRTLQFADRARSVMQSVRVNETMSGVSELQIAKAQIAKLKERLDNEQRRRHQTRLKEQEAAQKDFLEKLQLKEKEIQRLTRDNAVFSRWREEDLKKIRELESRVKAFVVVHPCDTESKADPVSFGKNPETASVHAVTTPKQRQHEKRDPPLVVVLKEVCATQPPSDIRRVNSKQSVSSQAITAPKRVDTIATKPYKQILERYALGSKKSNRRQEESPANEASLSRLPTNGNRRSSSEACIEGAPSTSMNQVQHEHDSSDLQRGRSDIMQSKLPEIDQGVNCVRARKSAGCATFTTEKGAAASMPEHYRSLLKTGAAHLTMTAHPSPASLQQKGNEPPTQATWRSERDLSGQTSRSGSLLGKHPSLQDPTPTLVPFTSPTRNTDADQQTQTFAATNARALSKLPESVAPIEMKDATSKPSSNSFTFQSTSLLASNISSACEKHSLKGCVLCAVRDSRSPYPSAISSNVPFPSANTSDPDFTLKTPTSAAKPRDVPCDRHQLANCFICSASSGIASATSFSTSISVTTTSHPTPARNEGKPSTVGPKTPISPLSLIDSKCAVHSLTNCVLCAGVKTTTKTVNLEVPGRNTDPASLLSSMYVWTSNQNSTSESNANDTLSGNQSRTRQAVGSSLPHQPSLQRRHSVEFESTERNDLIPTASPEKLVAHLRPQHSSTELHRHSHDLSISDSMPRELRDGATESPSIDSQSAKSSWYPSATRSSVKELTFDSNRKNYQALIREASDAATIELRRR